MMNLQVKIYHPNGKDVFRKRCSTSKAKVSQTDGSGDRVALDPSPALMPSWQDLKGKYLPAGEIRISAPRRKPDYRTLQLAYSVARGEVDANGTTRPDQKVEWKTHKSLGEVGKGTVFAIHRDLGGDMKDVIPYRLGTWCPFTADEGLGLGFRSIEEQEPENEEIGVGKLVRSGYGTGPFEVIDLREHCNCPDPQDTADKPRPDHMHIECRKVWGHDRTCYLNGYDRRTLQKVGKRGGRLVVEGRPDGQQRRMRL